MSDLISRQALCEYALNQKDKSVTPNDIMRFPSAQPEPCGEVVSREAVVKFFNDWMSALDINCHHQSVADLMIIKGDIKNLPSAQPEKVDIPTVDTPTVDTPTCEDAVSRQAAIALIRQRLIETALNNLDNSDVYTDIADNRIEAWIDELPSAQPEMNLDEWCTDCKEYDHERHCCPRWNRVIRQTLKDMKEEQPEIIRCKDCKYSDTDNTLGVMFCWRVSYHEASEDGFCSWAERRTDE